MNREDPYRDQVERLRQKIEKVSDDQSQGENQTSLPPRQNVHQKKKKRTKWRIKYPTISVIVLFFMLLPIVVFSIYTSLDHKKWGGSEKVDGEFETVDLETDQTESNSYTKTTEEQDIKDNDSNVSDKTTVDTTNEDLGTITDGKNSSTSGSKDVANTSVEEPVKTEKSFEIFYHTVQKEETIFRISMKYYQTPDGIDIIKEANQLVSNEIQTGQVLKIPMTK